MANIQNSAITVATTIRFLKTQSDRYNRMTFLYDDNWTASNTSQSTLPVAFFEVIKQEEVITTEVSEKRVILYQSEAAATEEAIAGYKRGLVNVVSDNIVNKPKVYRLECLVPYGAITRLFSSTREVVDVITGFITATANISQAGRSAVSGIVATVRAATSAMNSLLFVAGNLDKLNRTRARTDVNTDVTGLFTVADYNKASLEAMAQNRSRLRMKIWSGWDYKYVVVKSLVFSKVGQEQDYYRCSMEVVEMPVLSLKEPKGSKFDYSESLSTKIITEAVKKPLDAIFRIGTKKDTKAMFF